jgi:hypothetical protein
MDTSPIRRPYLMGIFQDGPNFTPPPGRSGGRRPNFALSPGEKIVNIWSFGLSFQYLTD